MIRYRASDGRKEYSFISLFSLYDSRQRASLAKSSRNSEVVSRVQLSLIDEYSNARCKKSSKKFPIQPGQLSDRVSFSNDMALLHFHEIKAASRKDGP